MWGILQNIVLSLSIIAVIPPFFAACMNALLKRILNTFGHSLQFGCLSLTQIGYLRFSACNMNLQGSKISIAGSLSSFGWNFFQGKTVSLSGKRIRLRISVEPPPSGYELSPPSVTNWRSTLQPWLYAWLLKVVIRWLSLSCEDIYCSISVGDVEAGLHFGMDFNISQVNKGSISEIADCQINFGKMKLYLVPARRQDALGPPNGIPLINMLQSTVKVIEYLFTVWLLSHLITQIAARMNKGKFQMIKSAQFSCQGISL
jgi:hypothetical protein